MTVRQVTPADAADWLAVRVVLWPDGSEAEHRTDISNFFNGRAREPRAVLIAHDETGNAIGFAEVGQIRCFRKAL